MTLEGERLSADDIVVRREMLAGARIDRMGLRLSFVVVAILFLVNLAGCVGIFVQTLQFFDPDYTLLALSILPALVLGYGAFLLRPRHHFTVLLRDGSALAMVSRDGTFLTLCLEAFERLWADPEKVDASLYLHAGHRSVDFGPALSGRAINGAVGDRQEAEPVGLALPLFSHEDDDGGHEAYDDVRLESPPQRVVAPTEGDLADALADELLDDKQLADEPDAPESETHVSSAAIDEPGDHHDELPPFPPLSAGDEDHSEPDLGEAETTGLPPRVPDRRSIDDEIDYVDELAASLATLGADEGEEGATNVPSSVFIDVLPRVRTLVGLLRERAPLQGISDAVDVLELMTRKGCSHPREGRALVRSVDMLRDRLVAYPAAIELLDEVEDAGDLDRFRT